MKKNLIVTAASFLFLSICSVVAYVSGMLSDLGGWTYLIIGVTILAISGIIVIFVGERIPLNIVCAFLSSVALGFCIRAWYTLRGLENDLYVMIIVSLCAALCLWLYFLLSKIPVFERHIFGFTAIFLLLSLAVYLIAVFSTETSFLSTLGYYMLIELAFLYALLSDAENKRSLLRNFTLSTYSVFGVAVLIALIAAVCLGGDCDCDCNCAECCDAGDCCDHDLGSKKKTKKTQ